MSAACAISESRYYSQIIIIEKKHLEKVTYVRLFILCQIWKMSWQKNLSKTDKWESGLNEHKLSLFKEYIALFN